MQTLTTRIEALRQVQALLRMARSRARIAGASRTTAKIRSALKSLDGAIRHASLEPVRQSRT